MAQYCRYCAHLVTGNGTYCEMLNREVSDAYAKIANKCRSFELNPIDAFDLNKRYTPRKPKPDWVQKDKAGQLNMFDMIAKAEEVTRNDGRGTNQART